MSNDVSKKLLDLKAKAEKASSVVDQEKGKVSTYYDRLKKDFGFTTLKEADKYIEDEEKAIEKDKEELRKGVEDLEEVMKEKS